MGENGGIREVKQEIDERERNFEKRVRVRCLCCCLVCSFKFSLKIVGLLLMEMKTKERINKLCC